MLVNVSHDWGNIVRDRRSDLGLTQADLARRIGRARQWVVRFESGHAGSASVDSLMAVLHALDLYAEVDTSVDEIDPDRCSWMSSTPGTYGGAAVRLTAYLDGRRTAGSPRTTVATSRWSSIPPGQRDAGRLELSLSLPKSRRRHEGTAPGNFLWNLLPDKR